MSAAMTAASAANSGRGEGATGGASRVFSRREPDPRGNQIPALQVESIHAATTTVM
jgi:hypothetical protein